MKRPAQNTRCRGLWLLLAVFALASACTEEKELRIRTSFVELNDDEMLSGHPDRLDRYNWSVIIEYPDSIIDNRGVNHPALCDTLKNKALDVIFGPENAARARADLLPPSRRWREGENAFVRQVKALTDAFNRHWIEGWLKKNWRQGKKDAVKNVDLWKRLLDAMRDHTVTFIWVRGHDGHEFNERCDKLATSAADSGDLMADEGLGL